MKCAPSCLLLTLLSSFVHCSGDADPVAGVVIVGGPGRAAGRFATPRGVAVHADALFVIDRSGRIQRFTADGEFVVEREITPGRVGFPIGLLADRSTPGVWVLDTHQSRVRLLDRELNDATQFGEAGTGPGQFTYPQRAAFDVDGLLYVAEYGDGDANRVQVFDRDGRLVRSFGGYGLRDGGFTRTLGIAVEGDEVFISDVSDRIVVYRRDGVFLREFGASGDDPGELRYPYGICASSGWLYVAEYGNHRVSRFDLDGTPGGAFGHLGSEVGALRGPWDVAAGDDGRLYIADTGNDRVVILDPRAVEWR